MLHRTHLALALLVSLLFSLTALADGPSTRPAPKPLSENVKRGLAWLAQTQLDNGAWGQGDESKEMGAGMANLSKTPNVADTCMVVMAFIRGGDTPADGVNKTSVLKGIEFICAQIEESDDASLWITTLRNTRTQTKLGTYVDTFFAAQTLSEVKDRMPSEAGKARVEKALAKVVKKIEAGQQKDGQWANAGWAPALAQAQAAKAVNVVVQNGGQVNESVRARVEEYAQADFSRTTLAGVSADRAGATLSVRGSAAGVGGGGDAGVALYSSGGQLAAMNSASVTNAGLRHYYEDIAISPTTQPAAREEARLMLTRFAANDKALGEAQKQVIARLGDKQFMAGFGSNGGEEFLSYLNIGESLFTKGGDDWKKWDDSMTGNLNKIQNDDGSWSGQHCITGRTFCTAAALQVLTIDRSPVPAMKKAATK